MNKNNLRKVAKRSYLLLSLSLVHSIIASVCLLSSSNRHNLWLNIPLIWIFSQILFSNPIQNFSSPVMMMILSSQHMLPRMCPLTTEPNDYLRCDWETHFKWLTVTNLKIKSKDTLHWTFAPISSLPRGVLGPSSWILFRSAVLPHYPSLLVSLYSDCLLSCVLFCPTQRIEEEEELCRPTIMQNHDAFDDDSVANYSNNSGQTLSIPIGTPSWPLCHSCLWEEQLLLIAREMRFTSKMQLCTKSGQLNNSVRAIKHLTWHSFDAPFD